ncbi:hypothetical protein F4825DRAFT_432059 [Nemania diffusa]|nr:hypothetical protein F4825DRAFT_432059 [Nemania diffusa]
MANYIPCHLAGILPYDLHSQTVEILIHDAGKKMRDYQPQGSCHSSQPVWTPTNDGQGGQYSQPRTGSNTTPQQQPRRAPFHHDEATASRQTPTIWQRGSIFRTRLELVDGSVVIQGNQVYNATHGNICQEGSVFEGKITMDSSNSSRAAVTIKQGDSIDGQKAPGKKMPLS